MSRDMNESIRIIKMPIGNVLQMIMFFYCENDEQSFRVLNFTWYHPVGQELLFLMVLANLKFIF